MSERRAKDGGKTQHPSLRFPALLTPRSPWRARSTNQPPYGGKPRVPRRIKSGVHEGALICRLHVCRTVGGASCGVPLPQRKEWV